MASHRSDADEDEHRLRQILTLVQRMNSEHDLSLLLDLIADEAGRLLSAERASIFLRDEQTGELWSKVATGSDQILRFDSSLGIAGAANSGETICVAHAKYDPRFFDGVDQQTGFDTRTILAVPLQHHAGTIIGAFEVLNKRQGSFTQDDVDLLKAFAEQAAVAIERARMFSDMKQRQLSLQQENDQLWHQVHQRFSTQPILGTSDLIQANLRLIERIRDSWVNVLIEGESGTGKELLAQAIHYRSQRARKPFVALNCAALPEALVESELFGIEKGVATGVDARIGKLEAVAGGTLFLDEIADLSLTAQAKVLRALQERVVERLGGQQLIPVDMRVVAATNKNLETEVRDGRFREDLYYRLKVVFMRTPPLRDIPGDIPLLAKHFLQRSCHSAGKRPKRLTPGALQRLCEYAWPGNCRQLENEMLRAAVTVAGDEISEHDLLLNEMEPVKQPATKQTNSPAGTLKEAKESLEREMIKAALAKCHHNQQRAARQLGLSRQGLANKIKRYGIS